MWVHTSTVIERETVKKQTGIILLVLKNGIFKGVFLKHPFCTCEGQWLSSEACMNIEYVGQCELSPSRVGGLLPSQRMCGEQKIVSTSETGRERVHCCRESHDDDVDDKQCPIVPLSQHALYADSEKTEEWGKQPLLSVCSNKQTRRSKRKLVKVKHVSTNNEKKIECLFEVWSMVLFSPRSRTVHPRGCSLPGNSNHRRAVANCIYRVIYLIWRTKI